MVFRPEPLHTVGERHDPRTAWQFPLPGGTYHYSIVHAKKGNREKAQIARPDKPGLAICAFSLFNVISRRNCGNKAHLVV